jgi:cell filamentation protein
LTADKYGTGQDPYCYPGSSILKNRLGLLDDAWLSEAEREMSSVAANEIDFSPPPYDLGYLQRIHLRLFADLYDWAGELRSIDIAKGSTRFCNIYRMEPEAGKLFERLRKAQWYEGCERAELVRLVAQLFGDLNVIHPFREGNGRAQRILFEHIVINAGHQISWWAVEPGEWVQANIDAVVCDYNALESIFERCIGGGIEE